MAKKRRKSGGQSRGKGIFTSIISLIVAAALVIAICRLLGITSFTSLIEVAREGSVPTKELSNKAADKINNGASCNVLKGDTCATNPDTAAGEGSSSSSSPSANPSPAPSASTQAPKSSALEAKLNALQVNDADKSSYSSADYAHWLTQHGTCDTRDVVLGNAGFASDANTCAAQRKDGFSYTDPYTNKKVSDPNELTIDYIIPLKYANAHNGASWDKGRKQQFANDTSNLVATSTKNAVIRNGRSPSTWMPDKTYTCTYATSWIDVASSYGISITSSDKSSLKTAISSCK